MSQEASSDLLGYPTHRISAIIETPEQLEGALRSLGEAAFPDDSILLLCGEDGARRIDASGAHHGLSARLTRATEHLFSDTDEMQSAEEALRSGKFVVAVLAPSDDEAARATAALRENGAHHIMRYGRWTTTRLDPLTGRVG